MWEDYRHQYGLRGRVISLSRAVQELPERVKRYRLVLIDESHNLRNRDGKRYRVIRDYVQRNESKVILLSATPYNKTYLGSYAYQIWKNAIDRDPALQKTIPDLPNVVYSTRPHTPAPWQPEGVLAYVRTADGNDALAWLDKQGEPVTESQFTILKAAECAPETPALPRHGNHHELVRKAVELIATEERTAGGQLGRPSGARFRVYERLKRFTEDIKDSLFNTVQLRRAIEDIYNYPLRQVAVDILNRQLRAGITDEELAQRVVELREDGRLCVVHEEEESQEPRIICSLGLKNHE